MIPLLNLVTQVDIKEKIENAPDKSYEIGVFIGTYLPYVLLVVMAYIIFYQMKKRKDLDK